MKINAFITDVFRTKHNGAATKKVLLQTNCKVICHMLDLSNAKQFFSQN